MKRTVLGEKPTLTTLGAKLEIMDLLSKAPQEDLVEILGEALTLVICTMVDEENQEKVVDLTAEAVKKRIAQVVERMAETMETAGNA